MTSVLSRNLLTLVTNLFRTSPVPSRKSKLFGFVLETLNFSKGIHMKNALVIGLMLFAGSFAFAEQYEGPSDSPSIPNHQTENSCTSVNSECVSSYIASCPLGSVLVMTKGSNDNAYKASCFTPVGSAGGAFSGVN
jgi:hypothetical protein